MDERKRKIINEMEQIKESALPENEKKKRISQLAGELGELITEKKKKAARGKRKNGISGKQKNNPG